VAAARGPDRDAVHVEWFGEQLFGFARVVRAGGPIQVAGQTAMAADGSSAAGDADEPGMSIEIECTAQT
jgi:hypothetical protein